MHFSNPLLWVLIFLFSVLVRHDAANADPSLEYQVVDEGAVFEETLDEKIDSYLQSKTPPWVDGENFKENGQSFFVAKGGAAILAPAGEKYGVFINSRQNAFDRAMLDAKRQMAQFLGQDIKAQLKNRYELPSFERENARIEDLMREGMALEAAKQVATAASHDVAGQSESETLLAISVTGERLVTAEIDKELRKLGFDPSQPIEGQTLEIILGSTRFESAIASMAKERLAGVTAYKTFERATYEENQSEIGVLVLHSERLHSVANALVSGDTKFVPAGAPKAPLSEQIPKTKAGLISSFGAQVRTDENGQLAVIAYAQQGPRTRSANMMNIALDNARLIAMGEIRFFAGEIIATNEAVENSENFDEFASRTELTLDDSTIREVEAMAESLEIQGITTLKRWQGEHPLTKDPIAGVIVAWSPSNANLAARMREKMQEIPTSAPKEPDPTLQPTAGNAEPAQPLEGSYEGEGAAPSDDDF